MEKSTALILWSELCRVSIRYGITEIVMLILFTSVLLQMFEESHGLDFGFLDKIQFWKLDLTKV